MTLAVGDTYYFQFQTLSSGSPADTDSLPTGTLYVNGSSTAVSVTITDSGVGWYRGSVSLAGRSVGDLIWVEISATIGGTAWLQSTPVERVTLNSSGEVVASAVNGNVTGNVGGNVTGSVGSISGTLTTLDALRVKLLAYLQLLARSDAAIATDNATELGEINADEGSGVGDYDNATDSLENVFFFVNGNSTSLGTIITSLGTFDTDDLHGKVDAVKAKTNQLNFTGSDVQATASNALTASEVNAEVDTGLADFWTSPATLVDLIWDEPQAGHTTADTFGDYLDASVSGVSTGGVSAGDIADAVWDESTAGHTDAGTFGEQLKTDVDSILADTDDLQTNQGNWLTPTGFSTHSAADVRTEMDDNSTKLGTINTNVSTLLSRVTSTLFTGITSLADWIRALARSDGNASLNTAVDEINNSQGDYDDANDSQEAIGDKTLTTLGSNAPAGWINAAAIGADAITGAKIAAGAIAKGDQLTGLNDLTSAQVQAAAVAAIQAEDLDDIAVRLLNMIEADGGDWRYTTNALEQAPAGGGGSGGGFTGIGAE